MLFFLVPLQKFKIILNFHPIYLFVSETRFAQIYDVMCKIVCCSKCPNSGSHKMKGFNINLKYLSLPKKRDLSTLVFFVLGTLRRDRYSPDRSWLDEKTSVKRPYPETDKYEGTDMLFCCYVVAQWC